jgi:hypothetical protein
MTDEKKKPRIKIDDIDPAAEAPEGEVLDDDLDSVTGGISLPTEAPGGRRMAKVAPIMPDGMNDVMRRF